MTYLHIRAAADMLVRRGFVAAIAFVVLSLVIASAVFNLPRLRG